MPLVVFVGTTDDPDSDDGLELAGLASEPLRVGWTRCNADSLHMWVKPNEFDGVGHADADIRVPDSASIRTAV
jgi:hypothetical protein